MLFKSVQVPHTGSNGQKNTEFFPTPISLTSASFKSQPIGVGGFSRLSVQLDVAHSSSGGTIVGPAVTASIYLQYSNDLGERYQDSGYKDAMSGDIVNWVTDPATRWFISGSVAAGASNANVISSGGTATAGTSYPANFYQAVNNVGAKWVRLCIDNANTSTSGSLTAQVVCKEY
jgi:hypothetical protein